jgi:hypothetical protein
MKNKRIYASGNDHQRLDLECHVDIHLRGFRGEHQKPGSDLYDETGPGPGQKSLRQFCQCLTDSHHRTPGGIGLDTLGVADANCVPEVIGSLFVGSTRKQYSRLYNAPIGT